jgi:hypothetical protein
MINSVLFLENLIQVLTSSTAVMVNGHELSFILLFIQCVANSVHKQSMITFKICQRDRRFFFKYPEI